MATYVVPANWTDQGERDVANSPKRLDVARQQLERIVSAFIMPTWR